MLISQAMPYTHFVPRGETTREIIRRGCELFGVSVGEVLGPRRSRPVAYPRMLIVAAMIELRPDLTLTQIGYIFGNRDHTTVIHARKRADQIMQTNPGLMRAYKALLQDFT